MQVLVIVLVLLVIVCLVSQLVGGRPGSIQEAPAGSFLAYRRDGSVEYISDVADSEAEECAADRLCEAGGCVRVEHKFADGRVEVYTPEKMRRLGW